MYQTSLAQFLSWFHHSLTHSKPANLVNQRVGNIIEYMTYHIYENVNRGLFGDDKLTFKLMCSLRICEIESGLLSQQDVQTFLKCGSALTSGQVSSAPKNPFKDWISSTMWTNVVALSLTMDLFRDLPDIIAKNEKLWRAYFEDEQPEKLEIPVLEERLESAENGKFYKMCIVRSIRDDRMTLVAKEFVAAVMGQKYIEPLSVTMEEVFNGADVWTPIILMLTPGADPTQTLRDLARSKV